MFDGTKSRADVVSAAEVGLVDRFAAGHLLDVGLELVLELTEPSA
jgi:hypothetical protein